MGYPMTWPRVLDRNRLRGGYEVGPAAGDLRRLEDDQRDEYFLAKYADHAGITPEQALAVLDALFTDFGNSS